MRFPANINILIAFPTDIERITCQTVSNASMECNLNANKI